MLADEERHAETALKAGGHRFPKSIKAVMTAVSAAMTGSSYRL
jgi:ubiquinone biosynthesis monooxygenase Coq7